MCVRNAEYVSIAIVLDRIATHFTLSATAPDITSNIEHAPHRVARSAFFELFRLCGDMHTTIAVPMQVRSLLSGEPCANMKVAALAGFSFMSVTYAYVHERSRVGVA